MTFLQEGLNDFAHTERERERERKRKREREAVRYTCTYHSKDESLHVISSKCL